MSIEHRLVDEYKRCHYTFNCTGDRHSDKPTVFLSACEGSEQKGDLKYNGGLKTLNNMAKILRQHGYEAFIVTYDGSYQPWLLDHQECISLNDFRDRLAKTSNVRCVTSWLRSKAFLQYCHAGVYFWDMELAYTEHMHMHLLAPLVKSNKVRIAGTTMTICAWHMAHWQKPCVCLTHWNDKDVFFARPDKRIRRRVGYMKESEYTEVEIETIRQDTIKAGLSLEFFLIEGDEQDCADGMRSCNVFLGLNPGKDILWGEGWGMPLLEAMGVGCAVICFDYIGNRAFVHHGFNGIMVPRYDVSQMARTLCAFYEDDENMERIRCNSLAMIKSCYESEACWPTVKSFLELDDR
ncbi:glycosyltransferase [Verrucomicrobiota bacterium]